MLFTDGNPSRLEDLRVFESSIYEVASVEGIDLEAKLSAATAELGDQILAYLLQPGSGDPQGSARRALGLSTLVVTPAMRRWHALHTLALTFRDAFHNQVNDRYRENWRHYISAAAEARSVLLRIGLGFVVNPLPRPGKPTVAELTTGQWPAGSYQVQVAWVNGQGQVSAPSDVASITTTGAGLSVNVSGAPASAIGWHVYVGESGSDLFQQNIATLAIGATWSPSSTSILAGEMPGSGQFADMYMAPSRTTPRG